jgi:hypothetical protein
LFVCLFTTQIFAIKALNLSTYITNRPVKLYKFLSVKEFTVQLRVCVRERERNSLK